MQRPDEVLAGPEESDDAGGFDTTRIGQYMHDGGGRLCTSCLGLGAA
jgi:hypothetical protein